MILHTTAGFDGIFATNSAVNLLAIRIEGKVAAANWCDLEESRNQTFVKSANTLVKLDHTDASIYTGVYLRNTFNASITTPSAYELFPLQDINSNGQKTSVAHTEDLKS